MEKVVKSILATLTFSVMSLSIEATPNGEPVGKIQDEFMVTPMGQVNYEIPIPALPGTGGMTPKLSVCYNSSTKSALFGYGFDLKGLSIICRVPRNIYNDGIAGVVDFTTNDRYALDGARLIQTDSTAYTRVFSTENESFSRIVLYGAYENPDSFTVQTKGGLKYLYLPNTKILDPATNKKALFWMQTRATDTNGNYFTVSYFGDNSYHEIYPSRIDYTGNANASLQPYASVRFSYEAALDTAVTFVHGNAVKRSMCIKRISLYSDDSLMKEFEFTYVYANYKKELKQVTEYAADRTALKPTTFQWSNAEGMSLHRSCYSQTPLVHKARLTIGDYNGDGKADFFATPEDNNAGWSGWRLFCSTGDSLTLQASGNFGVPLEVVSGDFNGDGLDDIAVLRKVDGYNYNTCYYFSTGSGFQSYYSVFSSTAKYSIRTIETNGDGAADLFVWFDHSTSYRIFYSSVSLSFSTPSTTGNSPIEWGEVEFGDFNGDGLTDVYNAGENGAYIMCSDGTGHLTAGTSVLNAKNYQKCYGDFNADGKTDILKTSYNGLQWSRWMVHFSSGTSFCTNFYEDNTEDVRSLQLFTTDINSDGFDDVVGIKKTSSGSEMVSPSIWLNDGSGRKFDWYPSGVYVYPLDKWNIYIADFNGDGKGDMLCTSRWDNGNNWDGFQLFLMPETKHLLLSKITDGMGNETEIEYKYMSDASVHTRGTTSSYPLSSFSTSWPVVSQVKTPNGIGGKTTKNYHYENALVHRKGRGVMGFEKVTVTDVATNTTTTTEYTVNTLRYFSAPTRSQTKIGSRVIAETETEYTLSSYFSEAYAIQPSSVVERSYEYTSGDLISETTTTYSYDDYGNVTYMQSVIGDLTTTTMNTYTNDTGRWLLGRLTSTLVSKSDSPFTEFRRAQFTYHPTTGLLMSETTEPYNQTLGFTKTYQRDVFGNITQSTTTPNSSNVGRTDYTYYDTKGRYITSYSNNLSHTCYNTIDEDLGLLVESEDANGVITTYEYDSFGRQTRALTQVSQDSITMGWSTGQPDAPANSVYYIQTKITGSPYKTEFFDCLGRTVRTVTENAFSSKIYADVIYNNKGQVFKTSEPYFPGSTIYWTQNEYDAAGRVIRQTTPAGAVTTTAYNGYVTTITDALGHQTVRTIDQYGNLVQSTDNEGGTIDYQYDLNGRCTRVVGPRTTINMEYDLMGNRTLLDDPDLGQVTSTYNAYGELTSQTDSKGTTTWQYDLLGRVISEQRPDVTITSIYDTNYIGLLTSSTTSDGNSVSYQYDAYGRVTQQTDVTGYMTFTTHTTYNTQNKVDVITYPSGLGVKYQYATNGILKTVKNASTNAVFWQLTQQDARGNATKETFGNGLVTTNTYNAATGYLMGVSTPGIQNWTYQYNLVGNLTQRKDNAKNLTETFEYDTLDRLVRVKKNGQLTQQMTYDAAGNILSKTGIGTNFTYQDGTNRLVSYDSDGYDPVYWDSIHYTSFHKINYVSLGDKTLMLTYGPSKTRVKANQGEGLVGTEKYYVGRLYEVTYKTNEPTRKVCYIFAAGKAVAIYETLGDASTVRYLHHDHLGSIQAYSDQQGNLVQELSYDAWGRRRNPTTWAYYTAISDANAWHERGFGGHEHLDLFEMVNMDGRMYDPVLGRFLSPDPFVQAPDYTQGLNRYTYCLNNPLSLVDPSGYSWLSDNWKSLVAAAVGIAVSALTMGSATPVAVILAGAAGGAAGALAGALLNGSNIGQIAKATFTGAIIGGISAMLNAAAGDGTFLEQLFKHTFAQGWLEGIQGGNVIHGFMIGAVSGTGGKLIHNNLQSLGKIGKVSANAILSGTVSELGGGKFANGAITGAFSIMFNDMMHSIKFKNINWKRVLIELRKLYNKYDETNNPELYRMQGGEIYKEVYMEHPERTRNACALKLCIALEKAGFFFSEKVTNSLKAANGHYYFVSAEFFNDYLNSLYKENVINRVGYDKFVNGTGIFFQSGNFESATGHIDMMYKGIVGGELYKNQPTNYLYY